MKKIRFRTLICNLLAALLCVTVFGAALSFTACERNPDPGTEFTVRYKAGAGGKIAGNPTQIIVWTDVTTEVTAMPELGYKFARWSDGKKTPARTDTKIRSDKTLTALFEPDGLGLPAIEIFTEEEQEITSKEKYVGCTVTLSGAEKKYNFTNAAAKIRGRGNSTWGMPKKPYKLKFEEKVDLFGNGQAKTWTLIANYCDPSLARNYLALSVAALFPSLSSSSTVRNVDLYLNGKYDGVYLVCEQNEVGKTRVDIDDSTESTDTGYLIELDYAVRIEGKEGQDYFTYTDPHFKTKCYQLKSPDPEDITKRGKAPSYFVAYIKSYVSKCMRAVESTDYEAVTNLIDVDSFAESYLVHELFHPHDVGDASFFLYKKTGGKLYSGPVWDFDISTGNCNYNNDASTTRSTNPKSLWAKELNVWYYYLLRFQEFHALVRQKLAAYESRITETIKSCSETMLANRSAYDRNFDRWKTLGTYVWPNPDELVKLRSWELQLEYVQNWLAKSFAYMKTRYPSKS